MKIAELMTRSVEFVDPGATVAQAAELMGEHDIGALPVGSAGDVRGIITDRDILFRVVAEGRDPARVLVDAVATRRVVTCRPDDTIAEAMELMAAHNVRRLPVKDAENGIVGWITLADLARHLLVSNDVVQESLKQLETAPPASDDPLEDQRR